MNKLPLLPDDFEAMGSIERIAWLENVSDNIERNKPISKPLSEAEKEALRDDKCRNI